jgi:hypothetical protein
MVIEELASVAPEDRNGPLIVNPRTGLPYRQWYFREVWKLRRACQRRCGIATFVREALPRPAKRARRPTMWPKPPGIPASAQRHGCMTEIRWKPPAVAKARAAHRRRDEA